MTALYIYTESPMTTLALIKGTERQNNKSVNKNYYFKSELCSVIILVMIVINIQKDISK